MRRYIGTTQSASPPGHAILVYDGGCGFCLACAAWLRRRSRVPVELIELDEAGRRSGILATLSDEDLRRSAHYVTPDGVEYHGGAAITRSLRLTRGGRLLAFLDYPPLSIIRDASYLVVSANRHRLSGLLRTRTCSR